MQAKMGWKIEFEKELFTRPPTNQEWNEAMLVVVSATLASEKKDLCFASLKVCYERIARSQSTFFYILCNNTGTI